MGSGWSNYEKAKVVSGIASGLAVQFAGNFYEELGFESEAELYQKGINPLNIDKGGHLGFNYGLDKLAMRSIEVVPELLEKTEQTDQAQLSAGAKWMNEKYFDIIGDPTLPKKVAAAVALTTFFSVGKELNDPIVDYEDIAANYLGTGAAFLDEYGEGSIRNGLEKILEPDKPELTDDEWEELYEQMEYLGKL